MAPLPFPLDSAHRGPLINIGSWIMMVFMCFAVFSKAASKAWKVHTLQGDDFLILAAMIAAIGQTVATSEQVAAGLGQHKETLSVSQVSRYQKAGYSAQHLYVISLGLAKMGTLAFVDSLARTMYSHRLIQWTLVLTISWTIGSVISVGFQCPIPRTWAIMSASCFNQLAFWDAVGSFDIVIDVMLAAIPMHIVWRLQMHWKKRMLVMAVFSSKLLILPLTVLRLVYIRTASNSLDQTYDDFDTIMATQFGMHFGIIITCFPFLKTMVDNLQPGVLASDVRTAVSKHSYGKRTNYALRSLVRGRPRPDADRVDSISEQWLQPSGQHDTIISAAGRIDGSSQDSGLGSGDMVIRQKTDFEIRSEARSPRPRDGDRESS